jgi:hypothetical protein
MLALIFGFLVSPSESMPERPHLAFVFTYMLGVMGAIGAIYWIMERLKRPIPKTIGKGHYLITLIAVACGIICTITAHDGVENPAWTKVPSFLSIKLFTFSVVVFLFGIVWAIAAGKPKVEFNKLAD